MKPPRITFGRDRRQRQIRYVLVPGWDMMLEVSYTIGHINLKEVMRVDIDDQDIVYAIFAHAAKDSKARWNRFIASCERYNDWMAEK